MSSARSVCVDASFAVKLVLGEPGSEVARDVWSAWLDEEIPV